jgi:hypothetical protein
MLSHLESQTRAADETIVSAPDETHVDLYQPRLYKLSYVFGAQGSSAQRNKALDAVLGNCDAVVFFDDDFLPADNYLERVEVSLRENPHWKVITGHVVCDGVKGTGVSFEEGLAILRGADRGVVTENLAANLLGSLWPEPYIDRLGRLKGNILAASHVLRGRIEPEFILRL